MHKNENTVHLVICGAFMMFLVNYEHRVLKCRDTFSIFYGDLLVDSVVIDCSLTVLTVFTASSSGKKCSLLEMLWTFKWYI